METRSGSGHTPLKPHVLSILAALAAEPLHGYALMTQLEQDPDGGSVGPATLYRTLEGLVAKGAIVAVGVPEPSGRRGSTYELTPLGRDVLRAELARLDSLSARAKAALGADG